MRFLNSLILIYFIISVFVKCNNYFDNGQIDETVKIPCNSDQICKEIRTNTTACINGVCSCNSDDCKKIQFKAAVLVIGKKCEQSSQCKINNAYCNEGKCLCKEKFVSSTNKRSCLPKSEYIGSSCSEDTQCISTSGVCVNKKCQCDGNTSLHLEACSSNIGFPCHNNTQCLGNSICKSKSCSCNTNYVKSLSRPVCLLMADGVGSSCNEDIQCSSTLGVGSGCLNGFCKCSDMHKFDAVHKKCELDTLLGKNCSKQKDCHNLVYNNSKLECTIGICRCKSIYENYNGYCVLSGSNKLYPKLLNFVTIILLIFLTKCMNHIKYPKM